MGQAFLTNTPAPKSFRLTPGNPGENQGEPLAKPQDSSTRHPSTEASRSKRAHHPSQQRQLHKMHTLL